MILILNYKTSISKLYYIIDIFEIHETLSFELGNVQNL